MEAGPNDQPGGVGPQPAGEPAGSHHDALPPVSMSRLGFTFGDFIFFRYMITPPLITVIYVIAVILLTIAAVALINTSALAAVGFWIVGMLYVRVILELFVVLFRINDGIQSIDHRGRGL
jgi:hypothetical protein